MESVPGLDYLLLYALTYVLGGDDADEEIGGYFDTNSISNKTYLATDAEGSIVQASGSATSNSSAVRVGSLFTFNSSTNNVVTSRVGISWLSTSQACTNLQNEIPANTPFSQVINDTKSIWNEEVLSKITTSGTNETTLELLYTSLYYMHLLPTNQTGENPGWTSDEPYYQDIFTYWVPPLLPLPLSPALRFVAY